MASYRSLKQFFLTAGQNNFGNKIPFMQRMRQYVLDALISEIAAKMWERILHVGRNATFYWIWKARHRCQKLNFAHIFKEITFSLYAISFRLVLFAAYYSYKHKENDTKGESLIIHGLLNRWTSQLDLGITTVWLERVVSVHNRT